MGPNEIAEVEDWFSYREPDARQRVLLEDARARFKLVALWLVANVEPSRERSVALTELRKAAMVVNQAIIFSR